MIFSHFDSQASSNLGPATICFHLKSDVPGLGSRSSIQGLTRRPAAGGGRLIRDHDERASVWQLNPSYAYNQIAASYNTRK